MIADTMYERGCVCDYLPTTLFKRQVPFSHAQRGDVYNSALKFNETDAFLRCLFFQNCGIYVTNVLEFEQVYCEKDMVGLVKPKLP